MQVTVRYFGIIGDMARRKSSDTVELPDGATIGDLLSHLSATNPAFVPLEKQVRAVVAGAHVTRDAVLSDGADITLMRAIGGG